MKCRLIAMLALLALIAAVPALALSPQTPEVIVRAVAGQTFEARSSGYESVGGNFAIYLRLYERARYSEADILAVGETDYIDADVGSGMVYSVAPDGDGYVLNESDPNADPVYLIPDGKGCFYAKDAAGNFYMKEALEVRCPIAEDAVYIDASDPDQAPAERTAEELAADVQQNRSGFLNVEVTFNENGEIARLLRKPSEEIF